MQEVARFNPERVAYFEANGWRAYYERRWFRLLRLILKLSQEQFHLPLWQALAGAYYIARASVEWAKPVNNPAKVRRWCENYYRLARRYSGLEFEPARAAVLEEEYWAVHRKLVGQPDKTEFIEVMARLHAEIFGLSVEQARPSAEWRVLANNTVDLISGKTSRDLPGDWARLEEYLRNCYRSILEQLAAPAAAR